MNLSELNNLKREQAREILSQCCGCDAWVEGMLDNRPYESERKLRHQADLVWSKLSVQNYLEAFLREHDRIDLVISLHKIVFTGANEKLPSLRDLKREEKAAEESYSYNNY